MKNTVKKIAEKMKLVFGYSIMITLFVGGITFFGYLAALVIGGDTAARICDVIYIGHILPLHDPVNIRRIILLAVDREDIRHHFMRREKHDIVAALF